MFIGNRSANATVTRYKHYGRFFRLWRIIWQRKITIFFVEKKAWSVVKDELPGCYFMPYVSKILHTYRPLVYVDCFAGKGKFDDGNPGSPLIALEVIDKCQEITSMESTQIEATFIDFTFSNISSELIL